ncbi:MAG: hypothetical protein ABI388_01820 [Bacteroidia bacterium]
MKKLMIAAGLLLSIGFASCKKNYVCECSKTRTSGGTTVTTVDQDYTFDDTKAGATSRCNSQQGAGSDGFGAYTRNCDIK